MPIIAGTPLRQPTAGLGWSFYGGAAAQDAYNQLNGTPSQVQSQPSADPVPASTPQYWGKVNVTTPSGTGGSGGSSSSGGVDPMNHPPASVAGTATPSYSYLAPQPSAAPVPGEAASAPMQGLAAAANQLKDPAEGFASVGVSALNPRLGNRVLPQSVRALSQMTKVY